LILSLDFSGVFGYKLHYKKFQISDQGLNMPRIILIILLALVFCPFAVHAQEESFEKKVDKLQKIDGYIPLYWDAKTGKMLMEISRFNREFRA
jgi:hypothetical protein